MLLCLSDWYLMFNNFSSGSKLNNLMLRFRCSACRLPVYWIYINFISLNQITLVCIVSNIGCIVVSFRGCYLFPDWWLQVCPCLQLKHNNFRDNLQIVLIKYQRCVCDFRLYTTKSKKDLISSTGPKSKNDLIKSQLTLHFSFLLTTGILWINLTAANQVLELKVKVCLSEQTSRQTVTAGFGFETQSLGLAGLDLIARSWHWLATCKTYKMGHCQALASFMSFYNSTLRLSVCLYRLKRMLCDLKASVLY